MVKLDDVRGGEATEPEEGRHIPDLPKGATEEILLVLEGEQQEGVPFTEGTFNTEDNKSSFEMQSLSPGASEVETEVTEEELALIAAELIAQGKIQAQFAAEWEEAEADGKEVTNYTGSVGLLRGGTRQIAKLILAGLVWLTASDWGTAKAHADPISLSAVRPNPNAESTGVVKKELSGEEIIRLEREEGRHVSLEEFLTLPQCKSKDAAQFWAEHGQLALNNFNLRKKDPNAKQEECPVHVLWEANGKVRQFAIITLFQAQTSKKDEQSGEYKAITMYYVVLRTNQTATREPYNLCITYEYESPQPAVNKAVSLSKSL